MDIISKGQLKKIFEEAKWRHTGDFLAGITTPDARDEYVIDALLSQLYMQKKSVTPKP